MRKLFRSAANETQDEKSAEYILISADSLRANHLGCYGYPLPTSPEIDKLAATGVLAEQMFCPVIPTQPSHTTLFTGQSPLRMAWWRTAAKPSFRAVPHSFRS